ncbi:tRNA 4-thiouridine(8) synthase ThiI [Saccharolobus solfataricus]|uniref:Probable tRNA sulfurtransferase n=3 Tax=Saccharolobus solfataricus TaxID=2287 RepID=THII_SACS2|nr:tRNA uracil 4-sulfurtransferase ThiI [Saccharolobus solfataricus]Q980G6.1 RecName: Full=Probable tRNA sulfurtransferase; AltName: Full=Sulfur carrier protein ThiS sulfurtransferase; AltName: Full=Thiamine biosynthesis protein ThiI; AltName: Full=tRNA 4-thiouridine synthase [Saccharolobus solfataricus P2]AAK40666.1 Thiamine biosynthesis protein thiI (thiI) [Saccharolobus solfataricus P2]AKA73644.1 tRNA 4-thiouridine(8) synthase ThiI [Saccharolobus solfataricus]AKA76341.1 tRNA 4-thiouridine(8)
MLVIIRPSGEIALKSPRSRRNFEYTLINNIRNTIGGGKIWRSQGVILLEVNDNNANIEALSEVFGISSFSPVIAIKSNNLEDIVNKAKEIFAEIVKGKIFAVRAKRIGSHSFTSLDVERRAGEALYPYSKGVDLENPEVEIFIEIRNEMTYFYHKVIKGPKGLPVGVAGKTVVLFSGGIDSPVATWMMMKRGSVPIILNFNLGGDLHKELVLKELNMLKRWSGGHKLKIFIVKGTDVFIKLSQVERRSRVVMLKRVMYKTAEKLCEKTNAKSITTGESLSQVSSQTMANLYVTEYGIKYPIFRPLIGFDKEEIVDIARKIGTYKHSIKLPEYCAISTKARTSEDLNEILKNEERLNVDYEKILENSEVIEL